MVMRHYKIVTLTKWNLSNKERHVNNGIQEHDERETRKEIR
jgi:hypothetical protein